MLCRRIVAADALRHVGVIHFTPTLQGQESPLVLRAGAVHQLFYPRGGAPTAGGLDMSLTE